VHSGLFPFPIAVVGAGGRWPPSFLTIAHPRPLENWNRYRLGVKALGLVKGLLAACRPGQLADYAPRGLVGE